MDFTTIKATESAPELKSVSGKYFPEYQKEVAEEVYKSCLNYYHLTVPKSITLLIGELATLRADTELMTWEEIQWIYDEVIPNKVISDKLYYASLLANDSQSNAFKRYNSYDFHDCVDEQGPTLFVIQCVQYGDTYDDGTATTLVGGYCNVSWFSPYKRGKNSKGSNAGYWVDESSDCKLFVLRDGDAKPMLAINKTTEKRIMVAANMDGPNFGFNEFFVTFEGKIYAQSNTEYFDSPKDSVTFKEFVCHSADVIGMEVFKIDIESE